MKKTLTINDLVLLTGNAYPHQHALDFAKWSVWDFKSSTPSGRQSGDGLYDFVIREILGGSTDVPAIEAIANLRSVLHRAELDLSSTVSYLEEVIQLAHSVQYVEWLIGQHRAHSAEVLAAYELINQCRVTLSGAALLDLRQLANQERILLELRRLLSIRPEGLPTGVNNEPLFDPLPNAICQPTPTTVHGSCPCPPAGQGEPEVSVAQSPGDSQEPVAG